MIETYREHGILKESINPNLPRSWKKDFLANASRAFDENRQAKETRREEAAPKKANERMLRTIGQLTLERDFFQSALSKEKSIQAEF